MFYGCLWNVEHNRKIRHRYRPHIGSDRLPGVIANLRRRIRAGGGEFLYQSRLVGLTRTGGQLRSLTVQAGPQQKEFETDRAILAVGHSARPLYRTLVWIGIGYGGKAICGWPTDTAPTGADRPGPVWHFCWASTD